MKLDVRPDGPWNGRGGRQWGRLWAGGLLQTRDYVPIYLLDTTLVRRPLNSHVIMLSPPRNGTDYTGQRSPLAGAIKLG